MRKAIPVSVIVMTKDEAKNISDCLRSVCDFAEVFVVDSGSSDGTVAIATSHGARVVQFNWNGKYPKKKQWSLENLPFSYDWVLFVDADERATPELLEEVRRAVREPVACAGYFVGLDYVFLGRTLRHGARVYKLALFNRHRGRFVDYDDLSVANMWEVEGHYQPAIDGPTSRLKGRLRHEDHDSLYSYFARHNRYSDWEAELAARGKLVSKEEAQPRLRRRMKTAFSHMPGRALAFFLYSYVLRRGFLDGRAGLHYATAKAFYYWQVDVKRVEAASLR